MYVCRNCLRVDKIKNETQNLTVKGHNLDRGGILRQS